MNYTIMIYCTLLWKSKSSLEYKIKKVFRYNVKLENLQMQYSMHTTILFGTDDTKIHEQ